FGGKRMMTPDRRRSQQQDAHGKNECKSFFHLWSPQCLLFLGFGRTLLYCSRAAEGIEHGVVALMAGIFEILISGLDGKRERDFERLHESLGIIDLDFVGHQVRSSALEALGQHQSVAGWSATAVADEPGPVA